MDILQSTSDQKKLKAALYLRVSTSEQSLHGYGLDMQRNRLLEYVKDNKALNLETSDDLIYMDVHTGAEMQRPALMRMLEDCRNGKIDTVLVFKIDRLSRSLKHLLEIFEQINKQHINLISIQENFKFFRSDWRIDFQYIRFTCSVREKPSKVPNPSRKDSKR